MIVYNLNCETDRQESTTTRRRSHPREAGDTRIYPVINNRPTIRTHGQLEDTRFKALAVLRHVSRPPYSS